MAGRKKKPFVKKPNVGRPFDKQGKLADAIRALSGKKMPFDKRLKMQSGGMAGASPAEIRDEKERQRKENRKRASQARDGQKAAKPLNIDKTPSKPASAAEQGRDLNRAAEIDRLRREEEKRRKERARASRATVGMGPAKITTGGGLGMMTARDRSKPKLLKDGGAVCRGGRSAERGTQFRGVR